MTQDFPTRGSLGAPDQINPTTQLSGDQKTPAFPTRGTEFDTSTDTHADVLGGSLYNVDPTKFDFFLKTGADNEELRAQDQSNAGMVLKGVGRLAATTLTKTLEGIGFLGAIPGAIAKGDMNVIVDNAWSDWWSNAEQSVKDAMPIYHVNKYNQGNILQQASTLGFWMDDAVDGLAFFASAWLGSKGINAVGQATKTYSNMAKLFTKATKAARTGTAPVGGQLLGKAAASEANLLTMATGNSFVEGMFEAKDTKDTLIKQGVSNEEASKAAMGTFWWNMVALMPSNYVTNSFLFKGIKAKGGRILQKVGADGSVSLEAPALTFGQKAVEFGKAAGKSVASEGPYEENIQLAIQNHFRAKAKGETDEGSIGDIASRWFDNFSTDEGQKAIFLGSLIGLIPGGIGGMKQAKSESENDKRLSLLMNTTMESVRNDPAMKDVWLKTTDPKTKEEKYITDENGKVKADPLKLANFFQSLYGTTKNMSEVFLATETGDQVMMDRLREQSMASLAFGMLYHPDGKVQYDREIELLAKNEIQRSTKEGEEVNQSDVKKRAEEYKKRWADYKNVYDNVTNNYGGLFNLGNSATAEFFKNKAIESQFMGAVDQMFWNEQKGKLMSERAKLSSSKFEDIEIMQDQIDDIEDQVEFIDKSLLPSLRKSYKLLLNESHWQGIHDITVEEAKKKADEAKAASESIVTIKDKDGVEWQVIIKDKEGKTHLRSGTTVIALTDAQLVEKGIKIPDGAVTEEKPAETTGKTQAQILKELDEELAIKKQNEKNTIIDEISKAKTNEEKAAGVSKAYGDHGLANTTLNKVFADIEQFPNKSISAFYNGKLGSIFVDRFTPSAKNDPEIRRIVFVDEETGKESIISTTNALGDFTLKQLGVVPLSHTIFDISAGDELGTLTIQGRKYGTITDDPLSSIEVDDGGIPISVSLLNEKGETIRFVNPTLVAELAYAIELVEHIKDTVSDIAFKEKGLSSDFIVVSLPFVNNKYKQTSRQYQLYRNNDGTIEVLRIQESTGTNKTLKINFVKVNKETKEKVIRAYYNDLQNAMQAAYSEVAGSTFRENQEQTEELKKRQTDAIKRAINASRPATAKEIIESPASSEVHTIKPEQTEEKPVKVVSTEVKTPKTDNNESVGVLPIPVKPADIEEKRTKSLNSIRRDVRTQVGSSEEVIYYLSDIPHPKYPKTFIGGFSKVDAEEAVNKYYNDLLKEPVKAEGGYERAVTSISWEAQGTQLSVEVIGDTGKEFLLTFTRNGKIELWSEKQPDGSYKASTEFASREQVDKLVKKYIPSVLLLKINSWIKANTKGRVEGRLDASKKAEEGISKYIGELKQPVKEINERETIAEETPSKEEAVIINEVVEKIAEAKINEPEVPEAVNLSTLGIEAIDKEIGETVADDTFYPKRGLKHTYSAIAYKGEDNVEFDKLVSEAINTLGGYYLMAEIDYADPYWEQHDKNSEAIKAVLDKIVKSKNGTDDFDSLVDTIPIKLVMYDASGNKTNFVNLNLHRSDFPNIVMTKAIQAITDPVEKKRAYEQLRKEEMTATRGVRSKVITQLLSGKKVVFANLEKGIGKFNNGDNSKISEIFTDTVNIRIGIADSTGTIYAGDNGMIVGEGNPGNVFLETKETANGKPFNIKLNPTKLTERQAEILYKAYRTAANSQGGWDTIMDDEEVEGLTVGEVINFLVLEGPITDQENTTHNSLFRPHLVNKQLWMDTKTGILTYGGNKLHLRKKTLSEEEKKAFIAHITANKNHIISINGELSLGKKLKRNFRIGDIDGKEGETYEQFLIKNSYILTDVIKDPVIGKPFSKPVIVFDASEFEATEPAPVKVKVVKIEAQKEEAIVPKVEQTSGTHTIVFDGKARKQLIEGSIIATSIVGDEGGLLTGTELGKIINRDGKLVFKITSVDKGYIEDLAPVEGLEVSDPKFTSKIRNILHIPLAVTVEVKEAVASAEVVVEAPKILPPIQDEEIAGTFTRKVEVDLTNYRVGNIKKARAYIRKKFGNIPVKTEEGIIKAAQSAGNVDAFGLFTKDLITLSSVLETGTEYHEAYHRVELLLLSPEQRALIYKEARVKFNMKNATETELAEKLAEGYRAYELSGGTNIKGLGEKIKQFFQDLWDFIKTFVTGELHITDLDIKNLYRVVSKSSGSLGRLYHSNPNKVSAEWLGNRAFNKAVKGVEFTTIRNTEQLDNIVDNIVYQAFKNGEVFTTKDLDNLNLLSPLTVGNDSFEKRIAFTAKKAEELKGTDKGEAYAQLNEMFQEIVDKYDTLLQVVKDRMQVLGVNTNVEEAEIDPEDESDLRGDNLQRYGKASFEVNNKDNAAANIKLMIATLRQSEELDPYTSLHKFVDFDQAWDSLQHDLQGMDSIEEMEAFLATKVPSDSLKTNMYKDLLARLRDRRRIDNYDSLRTQFFVTMKKNRNNMVNVSVNKKTGDHATFTVGNAETQRISLTYTAAWGQAFANSSIFKDGKPDKSFLRDVISEYKQLLQVASDSFNPNDNSMKGIEAVKERVIRLFNSVSIPMDMLTLDNILNSKVEGNTEALSLINFLKHRDYKVSYLFGDAGPFHSIITTGKVFSRGKSGSKELPISSIYKNESLLKEVVGNAYVESHGDQRMNSILGPSGHVYYLISDNNFLTDVMNDVNHGGTFLSGLAGVTHSKNSLWRQALADPKVGESAQSFIVSTFAQDESSDIGRGFDELTKLEDYLLKISLLESGYIPLPQLADRGQLIAMKGLPVIKFNYLFNDKNDTISIPDSVIQIFIDYIKDERARIIQVQKEIANAIEKGNTDDLVQDYHYSKVPTDRLGSGEKFHHFPSFNGRKFETIDLKAEVTRMLGARIEETVEEFTRLGIIHSSKSKTGQNTGIRNRLLDENIVKLATSKSVNNNEGLAVKNLIAKFVVNSISSTIESEKVFFGDPASYGSGTLKEVVDNKVKRASVLTSTGTNLRLDFGPDILPGDRLIHNKFFNSILLKTQKYRSEAIFNELVDKYVALGQDEKKVRIQLKGYLDVDQTDAQAYITPQMRRALKIRMGEWSELENRAYELIMSNRTLTVKEQSIVDNLYMEPLKFSYFGRSFTPGNGKPVMYKTSMATLTKQLAQGTQLEELYDRMQAKDSPVDVAIFDTGVKVGRAKATEFYETDSSGQRIEDSVNIAEVASSNTYKLPFQYLRRQQITEPHMEQYGKMHTQFRKIIMSNILNGNVYQIDGDPINGDALKAENTSIINELSNRGKGKFLSVLGYVGHQFIQSDRTKEFQFVADRARKANMPETFVEAVSSQVDGEFMEYDALSDRKWIHTTLISQMGKHTADIRIPGTALTQMSNFGLRKVREDKSLKLYDIDGYMECKVSVEIFRDSIPGYKDMNEEERMAAANELFVGVGYRIPTQGLSSTVPLKIVGFLPSTSTATIALPAEFTTLTGSDFDIDKLYFIRHNYDPKTGKKIQFTKGLALKEQTQQAIENRLVDIYLGVLLSNHHLIDTKTPLDASTKALKDQAKLIEDLEGKSKSYGDLFVASPVFQSAIKEKFIGGNKGIGPFALNNVHHVLGQMVGLGSTYNLGHGNIVDGHTDLSAVDGVDNIPILTWLSALINAHVDIAKDPYIFTLNVNQSTYNATSFLIRAGVGGKSTFAFLAQPVLKEYAEHDAMTQGRIKRTDGGNVKAGRFIKQRYKNLLNQALQAEKLKAKDVTPSNNIFDTSRLYSDIQGIKKDAAYYARQLQVIEEFLNIKEASYSLSNAVKATQIDTKKYGNNLMELKAFNNLVTRVLNDKSLIGMNRMFEETFLRTAYDNTIKLAFQLFSNNILMGTDVFSDMHDRILGEMGYREDTSRNAPRRINLIADELFGAIAGKFFVDDLGYDTKRVKEMFFGNNTISERLLALKGDPNHEKNPFVKLLNPVIAEEETDPNLLTLFNATENRTKWHKDRIIEGWTELLADPKHAELARDLVAYSFFTSGFKKHLHSFYQYIPPQYLKDIGYVRYIKNTRESFKDNTLEETIGNSIYRDVLKNLWHNSEVTPHLPESVLAHKRPFKDKQTYHKMVQISSDPKLSGGVQMKVGENLNGDPIFRPTFKTVINMETYIYRYIGYRFSDLIKGHVGVYAIDGKRGISQPAGKVIKEYGLPESIFDTNNIMPVTEEEVREMERDSSGIFGIGKETGKIVYDYRGFHHVPSSMASVVNYNSRDNFEEDTEGAQPVEPILTTDKIVAGKIVFTESKNSDYRTRTIENASADITVAIAADFGSAGEKLTKSSTLNQGKIYLPVSIEVFAGRSEIEMAAGSIATQINLKSRKTTDKLVTLNIAGNGIYTLNKLFKGYTQTNIDSMTLELFQAVNDRLDEGVRLAVRTGGQTGFDEAGAKAAASLGWEITINAPKGYKYRDVAGTDISNEKSFKARFSTLANRVGPTQSDRSPLTDVKPEAIKDNEQDYKQCKIG